MADSTRTFERSRRSQRSFLAAVAAAILVLVAGALAGIAGADGDPASDVLASQSLFLPQDAGVPRTGQLQLGELLGAAQRSGYQLRVAVIASAADLGSVTELWRQPQNYARFLGQELSLVYHGPLLVVMPGGYGQYGLRGPIAADQAAFAGLHAPGAALGTATLTAIQRLAAASGHVLALPTVTARSKSSSTDPLPWIVFTTGGALILIAWAASVRARPLQLRGTSTRAT
jgi:hypothetical protein